MYEKTELNYHSRYSCDNFGTVLMGSLLKEASFVMNVKCKALFQHIDSERSVSREPEDFLQRVPDLSFKLGLRKASKPKIKNKKVKKNQILS